MTRSKTVGKTVAGAARIAAAALLVAALVACSPEEDRRTGQPGADPGNRSYPVPELHGNRARNNPSAGVPSVGRVPADAKGVPGFWAQPGPAR
jgi:hypothetical protein